MDPFDLSDSLVDGQAWRPHCIQSQRSRFALPYRDASAFHIYSTLTQESGAACLVNFDLTEVLSESSLALRMWNVTELQI